METAAASAVMQFNVGVTARHDVMREMEIPAGCFTEAGSERKNNKRVKQANTRTRKRFKEARQKIRQAKLVEARLKAREGITYESAAFNEDNIQGSRKRKRQSGKETGKMGKSKLTRKK